MSRKRVDVRLPPELIGRVHDARGSLTFTAFVERALETALNEGATGVPAGGLSSERVGPPVSSRAPDPLEKARADIARLVAVPVGPRYRPKREVKPIPKKGK